MRGARPARGGALGNPLAGHPSLTPYSFQYLSIRGIFLHTKGIGYRVHCERMFFIRSASKIIIIASPIKRHGIANANIEGTVVFKAAKQIPADIIFIPAMIQHPSFFKRVVRHKAVPGCLSCQEQSRHRIKPNKW